MSCKHWSDCGVIGGGCCSLDLFGGKPSLGVCGICHSYDGPARGLGDRIAHLTKATGLKGVIDTIASAVGVDCGCSKRQITLNARFPNAQ